MENLLQSIFSKMGDRGVEKIGASVGLDAGMTKKILEQAGPLLIGKMADNAKSEEGRKSLEKALEQHDDSIFNKLDDVVNPEVDTKGDKILGHIFGNKSDMLVEMLAGKNGVDKNSTQKILEMAAPLILGQLGAQKKSKGLDAGEIFELLQGEKKENSNNMFIDLAEQFLDQDGDGSVVDDILGMAGGFFGKK